MERKQLIKNVVAAIDKLMEKPKDEAEKTYFQSVKNKLNHLLSQK